MAKTVDSMGAITTATAKVIGGNASNPQVASSITSSINLADFKSGGNGTGLGGANRLISGRTIQRMSLKSGGSINSDRQYIAKFENLCFINCLPPPANSIVDPPPLLSEGDISKPLKQFEEICGRDYVDRVLMRGQYLILVPLEMQPTAIKLARDKISPLAKLDSVMDRLDIMSYGYTTKVNSRKYNRAVTALIQSALMALGFEIGDDGASDRDYDANFFPPNIIERMYKTSAAYCNPFDQLLAGLPDTSDPAGGTDAGGNPSTTAFDELMSSIDGMGFSAAGASGDAEMTALEAELAEMENDKARFASDAARNMIKFLTNIDSDDQVNKNLPWVVFYVNGEIQRSIDTNSSLAESAIGKAISDIGAKALQKGSQMDNAAGQALSGFSENVSEDMLREAAFHNPGLLGTAAGFLVENTYIPSVIKESMLDMTYNIPLRQTCSCGDPYSLFRPLYVLCQLLPFVVPTNSAGSHQMVPESPMYCSAFVKGQMNLTKAAITGMSIRTNPIYQTSEGIPMEIDINLTIKPLQSMSAMPNFDTIFTRNMDKTRIINHMFNPLSPFNIIATLGGQNTVLSKFPYGVFYYFTVGTVSAVYSNIKGMKSYISDAYVDFTSTMLTRRSRILSLR